MGNIRLKQRLRTGITTKRGAFNVWETCNRHKKTWPEGDNFEEFGGKACKECVENARPTRYDKPKS